MLWSVFRPVTFEFVEGEKKKETKAIQFTTAFFFLML